jgi:hypothetical protein
MGLLLGHRYSHETISAMTEEVLQAVEAFRRRPLPEEMAFVYLDGLYLKLLREGEGVVREVVYVALGVTPSGERRVLGYWLLPAESALGWEGVLGELWQRGLRRVLLFITDGLPGLPEAIRRVYPQAEWQRCVVHGVRWSLGQVRARDRTLLAEDLRRVYGAESRGEALEALEALREAWGARYPGVVALWAGDSGAFLRFYGYPKVLWPYLRSTNLMERFIREIRRGTKVRDHKFPSEEAVYKLLYLGHGRQPVSWVGEARREVGGAAASRSEHLAAQGVLGGEGGVGEDAPGAVCPPYTNAYTYFLTRPLPPGPEKIEAAMLSRTIAAFCIIDDALQAMGHKDDPQTKVPSSVILTLAILAAMELGGKHNKALALAKDLNLFTHVPSPSRFNRRLQALYPLFLPLLHLLSQVWKNLHQAQAYALDTFPLPACENIRAPRSRLFPDRAYRGFIPSKRVYFHGPKLHLLVDDGKFIHEVSLTPGSLHDLTSLLLLPLDLPEGAELYMDRGYESHLYEDLLREAQGIVPMVIRRGTVGGMCPGCSTWPSWGGGWWRRWGACCTPCFPGAFTP